MKTDIVLLMTACIDPSASNIKNFAIHRSDTFVRLNDYKTAFLLWLRHEDERIKKIVFIDNSGYDLTDLEEIAHQNNIHNRTIEFIQLLATEIPEGVHYGYSELEMIDYAYENSKHIKSSAYTIKVTGRLYFPNISKLISKIKNHLILADCRDYNLFRRKKKYLLTTMLIFKPEFYGDVLYNKKQLLKYEDNGLIETYLYKILKPIYIANPKQVMLRLPFNVNPVGFGAHWNVNYQSKKQRFEGLARNILRFTFPKFWI